MGALKMNSLARLYLACWSLRGDFQTTLCHMPKMRVYTISGLMPVYIYAISRATCCPSPSGLPVWDVDHRNLATRFALARRKMMARHSQRGEDSFPQYGSPRGDVGAAADVLLLKRCVGTCKTPHIGMSLPGRNARIFPAAPAYSESDDAR